MIDWKVVGLDQFHKRIERGRKKEGFRPKSNRSISPIQPYWPGNLMKSHIQPVAKAIGIRKKIGWHTFRHSFGTLLKANGEDVKAVQELLRHANSRITLDVYTQAVNSNKRAAQSEVVRDDGVRRGSEGRRKIPANSAVAGLLTLSAPDVTVTVGRQLGLRTLESMGGRRGSNPRPLSAPRLINGEQVRTAQSDCRRDLQFEFVCRRGLPPFHF